MSEFYDKVKDRFLRYAKINTQSMAGSDTAPSTMRQKDLAAILTKELESIGVQEVFMSDECCVYGVIPSTLQDRDVKSIGFIAHMDTSPDAEGENVKPWILPDYKGTDVVLNKDKNIVLEVSKYPRMQLYKGDDMIFSDGTTLLGGDDKAAIASMMTFAEYLCAHPEIPHGKICIGFTPDEEIGRGTENFDIDRFGAELAYTVDGDGLGGIYSETFNGVEAQLTFNGVSVHPGTAKGVMKNAVEIAGEFMGLLPYMERPQHTELREGYYHPFVLNATVEHAFMRCILRDHELYILEQRKANVEKCVDELNIRYGAGTVELVWTGAYLNMGEIIGKTPYMIDYAREAIKSCGVEPTTIAMRGSTDGAWLSQKGLPCPNITAGYENAHGNYECVSIQAMEKNVEILLKLAEIYTRPCNYNNA